MFVSITNATINDVSFVGGTGGSRILDLTHENNKINTSGVIYDKDASLVYEITYTNDTEYNKKIADVTIPNNKKLKYKIIDLDNDKVILPGETVKFKYSIYSEDDRSFDELQSLNESAELQMSMGTVIVSNPNTVDLFFVAVFLFAFSFVCYKRFKSKKAFYAGFTIFLLVSVLARKDLVLADEKEMVQINTNIKYILSNLAPSCANTNYTGDFCIDWKTYGNRDVVNYLVMEDTKNLPNTYSIGDVNFTLQSTHDVSEQQNGDVILGVYKVNDQESYLFLIGHDGGVVVPKDASYQFTSYELDSNDSTFDLNYIKYVDFSKFYSNKTTNMSYMLTGIGSRVPMEYYNLSGFETSNVTDMKGMFISFGAYTENFDLDLSHFDTSNVTDMSYMFSRFGAYAENLKIDYFKDWDTRKVTTMKNMFAYTFSECYVGVYENIIKNPSVIDLTGLDSDSLTVVDSLFSFNIKVNEIIGIENLDFSKVESLDYVFMMVGYNLEDTMSLNLSNSNFSNVNSLSGTFLDSSFDRIVFHWNSEISSEFSNTFHGVKLNELIISAEKNVTFKDTIGTFKNIKL